jgi:Flp pilus assembly protein TadD
MKPEYHFHTSGNADRIREALNLLGGLIQTMTAQPDGEIQITWKPTQGTDAFPGIIQVLQSGKLDDGILLLELFLSDDPENEDLLFNLGMAYSDTGELNHAMEHLRHLTKANPDHTHGHVALGVALLRARKTDEGIKELQAAISQKPNDLWARRNLGVGLMQADRFTEAVEQLQRATELSPDDQAAWYGLGQALQFSGNRTEADKAYIKAMELDEFSEIAERAREARTKLAEDTFHAVTAAPRMDAVMYLVAALEKFEKLAPEQVRQIGFEIALLGTRGLDVNSPEPRYTLKHMDGSFSGLQLVCYEYAAFKQFAPEQNIGFDLSAEYQTALKLFKTP